MDILPGGECAIFSFATDTVPLDEGGQKLIQFPVYMKVPSLDPEVDVDDSTTFEFLVVE